MPIQIIYTRMTIDNITITDSLDDAVIVNGKFSDVSGILPDIYNNKIILSQSASAHLRSFINKLKDDLAEELDIIID